MASTATGLMFFVGAVPADIQEIFSKFLFLISLLKKASAIWLLPALCTHTNKNFINQK